MLLMYNNHISILFKGVFIHKLIMPQLENRTALNWMVQVAQMFTFGIP